MKGIRKYSINKESEFPDYKYISSCNRMNEKDTM